MSYYKPSFSESGPMSRGRGYSPRGYRGGSGRGGSWGGRGGYTPRGGGNRNFDSSFSNSFDARSKYGGSSERYSGGSRGHDDFRKSYKMESNYNTGRDGSGHRSPERKRLRTEAPSSRHDSSYGYGSNTSRYDSSYSERRSFSSDRHPAAFSRRDDFRRPSGPPRGGYRGRISSRGSRGLKFRDRPTRRRLIENSYAVRKRIIPTRTTDYARRLKISKMRSAIAARKNRGSDKEETDEEKDKEEEQEGDYETNKLEIAEGEEEGVDKKISDEKDVSDKVDKEDKEEEGPTMRKTYIKLNCPHCGIKAVTFRKYDLHLQGRTHMLAMRRISMEQKAILAQMRLAQRNAQNELEKTSEDLAPRTNFCPLCKLNYKQRKAVHQESEAHKNMKKFLMPYCKLCSLTFKSPMMFESHLCSIEHIKRKQRAENGDNSDDVDDDANLENFTTVDSVGLDGEGSEEDDKTGIVKEPISVGIEQIRKIEAYYCDLCKMYVGRGSEEVMPGILARHCRQRTHMQRYIRYKEDKDLEKRAEKLQRKETAEKEGKEKQSKESNADETKKEVDDVKAEKEGEVASKPLDDEEARDDKLWADVDKDLDDILANKGAKSSDEDEDVNGERYDRFKYSEKNGDEKSVKEGESVGVAADEVKVNEDAVEKK